MTVLVYLLELTSTGSVGERATPSGPVHTVFTVTGTSTDESNTTVQVRVTVAIPTGLTANGLDWSLVTVTELGAGTIK